MINIYELLYDTFELYTDKRKRFQIEMVKQVIFELKMRFNSEFDNLVKDKNAKKVDIADKQKQIDELLEKLESNLEEVRARGGELYVFADPDTSLKSHDNVHIIPMPRVGPLVAPIVYTIPLQLLSYHAAVLKGTDVDQPRNLAKSVTVE